MSHGPRPEVHMSAMPAARTSQPPARPSSSSVRTAGAVIASCGGAAGAATIAAHHGNGAVAVVILLTMQAWSACELICRWRLRWRVARLQEDIARRAMDDPANENLRTLLADVAGTYLDELGTRLPLRPNLMAKPRPAPETKRGAP